MNDEQWKQQVQDAQQANDTERLRNLFNNRPKPLIESATDKPTYDQFVGSLQKKTADCPGCEGTGQARPGVTAGPNGACNDCLAYRATLGPGQIPLNDMRDYTVRYKQEFNTSIIDPHRTRAWLTPLSLPRIVSRTLSHPPTQPVYSPDIQRRLATMGPYTRDALRHMAPDAATIERWLRRHDQVARLRIEARLKRRHQEEMHEMYIFLACCAVTLLLFVLVAILAIHQVSVTH
jgi:hypothetical protein